MRNQHSSIWGEESALSGVRHSFTFTLVQAHKQDLYVIFYHGGYQSNEQSQKHSFLRDSHTHTHTECEHACFLKNLEKSNMTSKIPLFFFPLCSGIKRSLFFPSYKSPKPDDNVNITKNEGFVKGGTGDRCVVEGSVS